MREVSARPADKFSFRFGQHPFSARLDGTTLIGYRRKNDRDSLLMSLVPTRGLLAVLAVVDIALNATQRPLSAKSLASRYNLAPRYLEPMLQMLVHVGILKGVRGPHGGYRLGRPPSALTVADILQAALADNSDPYPPLSRNPVVAKVILPSLDLAERMMSDTLKSITIETLANRAASIGVVGE